MGVKQQQQQKENYQQGKMIVIEIANDADDKKLNLFSKRDFIGGKENYFTEIVFYLDTNLKFSPKCELSYFCFFLTCIRVYCWSKQTKYMVGGF